MNLLPKSLALVLLALLPTIGFAAVDPSFGATPDLKVSGKNLVDPQGNIVVLHGVMETPNAYFNSGRWTNGVTWADYNQESSVTACLQYFTKMFNAVANPTKGTYCNLFRLHLDPCWLQDNNIKATGFTENNGKVYDPHGSEVSGEANIYHFSSTKLRTYLDKLYIPIIKDAIAHGLYVIVRPPGVFPHEIVVGDYYNEYLKTVWDIVSNDSYIKEHSGQISLELGNEPVHIWESGTTNFTQNYYAYDWNRSTLYDFFQPIVNRIRSNGFNGIIWLPGTGYQAEYRSYKFKMVTDTKNNIGFAAHFYPGWYSTTSNDANRVNTNETVLNTFKTQIPVQANYPIVITEVDWSPKDGNSGHYDEHGDWVTSNFGTWGTGSTSEKSCFGDQYKYVVDQCGNVSWTIEGSDLYVDMDKYLLDKTVQPAFLDKMKAAGYANAYQACSGSCFQWFEEYAGKNVPQGVVNVVDPNAPDEIVGTPEGNAALKNGHYEFYTTYSSAFIFKDFAGTPLVKCADFTVNLGESTTGYRLDVQLKDASGNIIKDGTNDYIIGTEAKGTRLTSAESKVYDFQDIFADYIKNYPGCTVGDIRINTAIASNDENREGLYYFTLDEMSMNVAELTVRAGSKGTSLTDIKMYKHETTDINVVNDNVEDNAQALGGWGNSSTRTIEVEGGNHFHALYNPAVTDFWGAQAIINCSSKFQKGKEYTIKMKVKGTKAGSIRGAFHDGTQGCGDIAPFSFTTSWQEITLTATVINNDADRLYINYGDYAGTVYLDDIRIYYPQNKVTEITGNNIALGEERTNGVEVFGAGLIGNVAWNEYADLTEYSKMIIKGTGGSLRVLYNRPETGACPELNPTLASGEAEIDLTAHPYFHLNSIKAGWGQTVNVESITLIDGSGNNIEIADYYISGAGHEDGSVTAALADANATVIDIQNYVGVQEIAFQSANPNCFHIYREGTQVGNVFGTRNMVKSSDNSTYQTTLTDGFAFRAPFDISTYAGASYTRNLDGKKWGTIALPFALDVTATTTARIFKLSSVNGETMTFTEVTEGTVAAGSVILYYNAAGGEVVLKGKNIAKTADGFNIQPAGVNGWFTAQSFTNQVIDDVTMHPVLKDYDVYGISENNFVNATKKLTLKPFRAFFLAKKSAGARARFNIHIEGNEENGIMDVENEFNTTVNARYDAAGRRVNAPVNGINIIRMSDGTVRKVMR